MSRAQCARHRFVSDLSLMHVQAARQSGIALESFVPSQ
jgi:hypothetical protein